MLYSSAIHTVPANSFVPQYQGRDIIPAQVWLASISPQNAVINCFWVSVRSGGVSQTAFVYFYQVQLTTLPQDGTRCDQICVHQTIVVQNIYAKIGGAVATKRRKQHNIQLRDIIPIQCGKQIYCVKVFCFNHAFSPCAAYLSCAFYGKNERRYRK